MPRGFCSSHVNYDNCGTPNWICVQSRREIFKRLREYKERRTEEKMRLGKLNRILKLGDCAQAEGGEIAPLDLLATLLLI